VLRLFIRSTIVRINKHRLTKIFAPHTKRTGLKPNSNYEYDRPNCFPEACIVHRFSTNDSVEDTEGNTKECTFGRRNTFKEEEDIGNKTRHADSQPLQEICGMEEMMTTKMAECCKKFVEDGDCLLE